MSPRIWRIFVLGRPRIAVAARGHRAMTVMAGPAGGTVMTVAILVRSARCRNILARRVFFAMARDGRLFSTLAAVPTYQTPANAIWTLAIWSVLTLTSGFSTSSRCPSSTGSSSYGRLLGGRAAAEAPERQPYRVSAYP